MTKKNVISLLILAILVLAIPIAVTLVRQQQTLRSRAAGEGIVGFRKADGAVITESEAGLPLVRDRGIRVLMNNPDSVSSPSPTSSSLPSGQGIQQTLVAADGKTVFTRTCHINNINGNRGIDLNSCSGWSSAFRIDTDSTLPQTFRDEGITSWHEYPWQNASGQTSMQQILVAADGKSVVYRSCSWPGPNRGVNFSNCSGWSSAYNISADTTLPQTFRDQGITSWHEYFWGTGANKGIQQILVHKDGKQVATRTCKAPGTNRGVDFSNCTGWSTAYTISGDTTLPQTFRDQGITSWHEYYWGTPPNNYGLQQVLVAADGKQTATRTCHAPGPNRGIDPNNCSGWSTAFRFDADTSQTIPDAIKTQGVTTWFEYIWGDNTAPTSIYDSGLYSPDYNTATTSSLIESINSVIGGSWINQAHAQSAAPTATISGPTTGTVGSAVTYSSTAGSGVSVTSAHLWIAKDGGNAPVRVTSADISGFSGTFNCDNTASSNCNWYQLAIGSTSGLTVTFTPLAAGTYKIIADVTDNQNRTCSSNPYVTYPVVAGGITFTRCGEAVTLVVSAAVSGSAPTATISGPTTGTVGSAVTYTSTVTSSGTTAGHIWIAKEVGGAPTRVTATDVSGFSGTFNCDNVASGNCNWYQLANGATSPLSGNVTPLAAGTYKIIADVTDNQSRTCSSNPYVTYPVTSGGITFTRCGEAVTLVVSAAGGGSGPTATISGPTTGTVGSALTYSSTAGSGVNVASSHLWVSKDIGAGPTRVTSADVSGFDITKFNCTNTDSVDCNWYQIGTSSTSPLTGSFTPLSAGNYKIITDVTDTQGRICSSNPFVRYPYTSGGLTFTDCVGPAVALVVTSGTTSPSPTASSSTSPVARTLVSYSIADSDEIAANAGILDDASRKVGWPTGDPNPSGQYTFFNDTEGTKTVFVKFFYSSGDPILKNARIVYRRVLPEPVLSSATCKIIAGSGTAVPTDIEFTLTGAGFGTTGTLRVTGPSAPSGIELPAASGWTDTSITRFFHTPATKGQAYTVTVKRGSDNKVSNPLTCTLDSDVLTLSLGAKLFCRAPSKNDASGVELVFIEQNSTASAQLRKQKESVSISRDGIITGIRSNLIVGRSYVAALKAPKGLRQISAPFPVSIGATIGLRNSANTGDILLPVGNFNNDATIDTFDYALLKNYWPTKNLEGDLNRDGGLNSVDFACMRYDLKATEPAEPN